MRLSASEGDEVVLERILQGKELFGLVVFSCYCHLDSFVSSLEIGF